MSQAAWVPDEAVTDCRNCHQKFSLLVRKHHCRSCGQVFCAKCSSRRTRIANTTYNSDAELVRVCDTCYQLSHRKAPAKTTSDDTKEILLYNTHSICPKCSILERRGFDLQPASIIEYRSSIYLRLICSRHSHTPLISLVCSNAAFYHRMTNFCHDDIYVKGIYQYHRQPRLPQQPPKQLLTDIEDLTRVMALGQHSQGLPLSMDITLFRDDQFLTDEQVDEQLMTFAKVMPRGQQVVIKLIGGLVEKQDIPELNRRILRMVSMATSTSTSTSFPFLRGCPLLIDLSFERMIDLCTITDSALLRGRVYPCVRYFLTRGDEQQFITEMTQLTSSLLTITDMQLVLLLSVDQPYPDMTSIMQFIRQQTGLIRFIVISRERSPKEIFARLARVPRKESESDFVDDDTPSTPPSSFTDVENIDPYELLQTIETHTSNAIRTSDWIPFRAGCILEPLFQLLGYGNYHFRPSPMCAFTTLLINTSSYKSIPISRFFDMQKLYTTMEPISQRLRREKMGLWTSKAIQKALKESAITNAPIPDVFSYATSTDNDKQQAVAQFVKHMQLIVIHNKMDFSTVDAIRRCNCATVTPSPIDSPIPVAACTGCI